MQKLSKQQLNLVIEAIKELSDIKFDRHFSFDEIAALCKTKYNLNIDGLEVAYYVHSIRRIAEEHGELLIASFWGSNAFGYAPNSFESIRFYRGSNLDNEIVEKQLTWLNKHYQTRGKTLRKMGRMMRAA